MKRMIPLFVGATLLLGAAAPNMVRLQGSEIAQLIKGRRLVHLSPLEKSYRFFAVEDFSPNDRWEVTYFERSAGGRYWLEGDFFCVKRTAKDEKLCRALYRTKRNELVTSGDQDPKPMFVVRIEEIK